MITIENFSFKYDSGSEFALKDINLTVNDGDFIGIIGNSGAGKSTLTYALNGIIPHHFNGDFYGQVKINGLDTVEVQPERLSKFVGSIFQDIDGHIVASIVEDELLFGLENFGVPHEEIENRITESLEAVGISDLRNRAISTLSGGQKQKAAIAAVLALKPKIMVLDEPTGELDPKSSYQVFEVLKELNNRYGMTIVIVEQKIMLLCEFVKRLAVMHNGEIACEGEIQKVLQNSRTLEEIGINIPRIVTLKNRLESKGLYSGAAPTDLKSAEIMVREILK